MTARDALADGRLADAVAFQSGAVAMTPGDPAARLFLFELLVLSGALGEARAELLSIRSDDPDWPDSRRAFLRLLHALRHRERLARPRVFLHPPKHLKQRWKATERARANDERAVSHADRADAATPELTGFVDGREFVGIRDADDRFASVLEVCVGPRWAWVPFEQVRKLRLSEPEAVLDVAVRPARLTLTDGREFAVSVPLTYPGSAAHGDDFALGNTVDWTSADGGGLTCGLGARVLAVGDDEVALGECRMLEFRG